MKTIEIPANALTYSQYVELIDSLVSLRQTTGLEPSEARIEFTRLNQSRMKRVYKTFKPADRVVETVKQAQPQHWLVITEAWCGDGAQSIPVMARLAELNAGIQLSIVLRDEHPELMNQFLTNGARAIPVLIFTDPQSHNVSGQWGARPAPLSAEVRRIKAEGASHDEISLFAQEWYNADKGQTTAAEIEALLA